jgi:hypothetical protein
MKILLSLVPLLALIAGLVVYQHNGRKEILRFDLVQFFYAFVLMPVIYVWFKSFLFFLLESQLHQIISGSALLFWDTVYSVIFLFIYAFTVIHSLTKSFELKVTKDPLYDLFEHSEYYHRWITHTAAFAGVMVVSLLLAALNAWIDLPWILTNFQFYLVLLTSVLMAGLSFKVFLISDFGDYRFVKLMKLLVAIFLVMHIAAYAVFEPDFSGVKAMFWYQFTFFLSLSVIGIFHDSEPDLPVHRRIKRKVHWFWRKLLFWKKT